MQWNIQGEVAWGIYSFKIASGREIAMDCAGCIEQAAVKAGHVETCEMDVHESSKNTGKYLHRTLQTVEAKTSLPGEKKVSSEVIELAKYNIVKNWRKLATQLDFSEEEQEILKLQYLGMDEQPHLEMRNDEPGYVALVEKLIELAECNKKIPVDRIIQSLDSSSNCSVVSFSNAQKACQVMLDNDDVPGRKFSSNIFLIWIKHPDKKGDHPIPNTELRPVQQKSYDWAIKNPDKLVVLWYSSSTLNHENNEEAVIFGYQKEVVSSGACNLFVLDVDKIDWGDKRRKKYRHLEETYKIDSFLTLSNFELSFMEYLDGLRVALLSEGSQCIISSASRMGWQIREEDIPENSTYFDQDYEAIPFRAYRDSYKPLCRDACFDKYCFMQGIRMVDCVIPNSMLATCNEHQSTLDRWPIKDCFGKLDKVAECEPYLFGKTKVFRMSDVNYDDNGIMTSWKRITTWTDGFKDQSRTLPLLIENKAVPEYLIKYLQKPESKDDPMAPALDPDGKVVL